MSRSYKKFPCVTDSRTPGTKHSKRFANKKVRHTKNIPSGGAYKQIYESWDIRDYKWIWTWQEAKEDWEEKENSYLRKHYPTLQSYYRYWLKCAKSK